jgi:signal transduction histidine kinase
MEETLEKTKPLPESGGEFFSAADLSAVLAHEIANPLNAISAAVHLIEQYFYEKEGPVDQTIVDLLRLVAGEINRLTLLLNEFRSLRLSSLDLQPTSLATVVKRVLDLESIQAAPHRVHIEQAIPPGLPLIMADRAKLEQVVMNLCKNAIEAMRDGGTLSVRCFESEGQVCLDICDSGEGIPEGMEIFKLFVTHKPHGTGLGLMVVKGIVLAHGGTISYTNKPAGGTIFHLNFPISRS